MRTEITIHELLVVCFSFYTMCGDCCGAFCSCCDRKGTEDSSATPNARPLALPPDADVTASTTPISSVPVPHRISSFVTRKTSSYCPTLNAQHTPTEPRHAHLKSQSQQTPPPSNTLQRQFPGSGQVSESDIEISEVQVPVFIKGPDTASAKQLSADEYTVGWICAVRCEYVAARAMLQEVHRRPDDLSPNDKNDYELGQIGDHNVVIAVLPSGGYGKTSATNTARDMLASFPNIKIGLMVGIGGSAPSKKNDVRLGDIVVSVPDNSKPGVFQYDYGKAVQGRAFEATGVLNKPPRLLLNAVNGLRAEYERLGGNQGLVEAVNEVFVREPELRKDYQRPASETDNLFKSNITHSKSCLGECCNYQRPEFLEQRHKRARTDRPEIYYGLIASGDRVMKDALVRDRLASEGVLCFEMEAAGLMDDFPCLVVRGICDYSDTHKNKEWQGYAAMVAAAYAKNLLFRITPVQRTLKESEGETREILEWVTPINYGPRQSDFLSRKQSGTVQWLLDSERYCGWVEVKGRTLFCPGVPGAGKTILAATVIDNLHNRFHENKSVGIAYIYLNSGLHHEQALDQLLASLVKQLLQGRRPLPEDLRNLHKSHKEKWTRPSAGELLGVLDGVVRLFSRTFIIVDALDEGQETDQCIATLAARIFQFQAQTGVSFMATSRPIPVIEKIFNRATCVVQPILASDDDICRFIEGHLGELRGFVREMPELQNEIKSAITAASGGMFLLAELYFAFLKDKTTPASIKDTLKQFQSSGRESSDDEKREVLSRAYDRVMERIDGQQKGLRRLARRVLTWIVAAKQPLGVEALQHALGVQIGKPALDEQNIERAEDIVSVCMGLVTINAEDDVIRLMHTTVREYFDQQTACQIPDLKIKPSIASVCVSYLSFAAFSGPEGELVDSDLSEKLERYPLYEYAAVYWGHHARENGSAETDKLIRSFVDRKVNVSIAGRVFISSMGLIDEVAVWDEDGQEVDTQTVPRRLTAAHLIAYFGLERTVADFIKRGLPMDERDTGGMTPLAWAARGGHEAVVDLLLASGRVDPVAADSGGRTPLLWAMWFAREAAVRRFLESGKINVDSSIPAKPVLELPEEADISLFGGSIQTTYFFNRLARKEIDVVFDLTPLAWAAFIGDRRVVEAILAAVGEDVDALNAKDITYGRTPLWWAVRNEHREALEILLETNGVDPDVKDNRLQTPLNRAAANGRAALIRMLLYSGRGRIDLNSKDKYGLTPLYWAAWFGHEEVVDLLLVEPAVHLSQQEENDCSPLLAAAENGHAGTVSILLAKNGVDVNPKDENGCTPLLIAAKNSHFSVVLLLLAEGDKVDVNAKDKGGSTPLLVASEAGHVQIVSLLLARGSNSQQPDEQGRTPLSVATTNGHWRIVQLLSPKNEPGTDNGEPADCGDEIGPVPPLDGEMPKRREVGLEGRRLVEEELRHAYYNTERPRPPKEKSPKPVTQRQIGSSESLYPYVMGKDGRMWCCCCIQ